jgi:ABC-2 type transport system permease protein
VNLSIWRVTRLISSLAWRRLGNRLSRLQRGRSKPGERTATARKRAPGKLLLGFMALVFAFQVVTVTTRLVERAAHVVEDTAEAGVFHVREATFLFLQEAERQGACGEADPGALRAEVYAQLGDEAGRLPDQARRDAQERALVEAFDQHCLARFRASSIPARFWPDAGLWYEGPRPLDMQKALGVAASLLALALALNTVAGAGNDLTSIDTRLEFLFVFPVRARALFLARVLSLTLASPVLWVLALPFYGVIFFCAGFDLLALPLAAAATLYLGLLSSALRVLVEAILPRLLSPRAVARCQAALLVASYLSMVVAAAYSLRASQDGTLESWLRLPDVALYAPPTVPLLLAAKGLPGAAAALLAPLFVAALVTLAVLVGEWSVRDGFVVSTSADQLKRGSLAPSGGSGWLSGAALKELRAIFRDRQLRMQAFVSPALLVLVQIWLNPSLLTSVGESPRALVVAAFATSMFTLTTGACALLATEGTALWMLYTLPVSLERILASKLRVWIGVALFYAVAVLTGVWWREPQLVVPTLPYVPLLVIGIVIYAVIALGIGALGTDPLEAEPRRRVRPGAVYLFMLLAALFGHALFTASWWAKVVEVVLSVLLAYALWQKLRDQLPYLLDPTEEPPPSLSVADGVLAAMAFFVLQGLFSLLFWTTDASSAKTVALAFAAAGGTVSLSALWFYQRAGLPRLLETLGLRRPRSVSAVLSAVGTGVLAGGCAAALAVAYALLLVPRIPFLKEAAERAPLNFASSDPSSRLWLLLLLVIAAPLFEELIFRGILFAGFRRSLGTPAAAVASSAVFALVHPPVGAPVVFVMALFAAFVFERCRWLGGPIATHCVYNGVLVFVALG